MPAAPPAPPAPPDAAPPAPPPPLPMPPVPPEPASPELELLDDAAEPVCCDEPPVHADVARLKANEATMGNKKEDRVFMRSERSDMGLGAARK
jgi:hypothetical protein